MLLSRSQICRKDWKPTEGPARTHNTYSTLKVLSLTIHTAYMSMLQ